MASHRGGYSQQAAGGDIYSNNPSGYQASYEYYNPSYGAYTPVQTGYGQPSGYESYSFNGTVYFNNAAPVAPPVNNGTYNGYGGYQRGRGANTYGGYQRKGRNSGPADTSAASRSVDNNVSNSDLLDRRKEQSAEGTADHEYSNGVAASQQNPGRGRYNARGKENRGGSERSRGSRGKRWNPVQGAVEVRDNDGTGPDSIPDGGGTESESRDFKRDNRRGRGSARRFEANVEEESGSSRGRSQRNRRGGKYDQYDEGNGSHSSEFRGANRRNRTENRHNYDEDDIADNGEYTNENNHKNGRYTVATSIPEGEEREEQSFDGYRGGRGRGRNRNFKERQKTDDEFSGYGGNYRGSERRGRGQNRRGMDNRFQDVSDRRGPPNRVDEEMGYSEDYEEASSEASGGYGSRRGGRGRGDFRGGRGARSGNTERNGRRNDSYRESGRRDNGYDGYRRDEDEGSMGRRGGSSGAVPRRSNYNQREGAREQYPKKQSDRTKYNGRGDSSEIDTSTPGGQRENMALLLERGDYECSVCCEYIRPTQPIWSCRTCYNCLHLPCARKWAKTSRQDDSSTWNCPTCLTAVTKAPGSYHCFCGKRREPEWHRGDTPHTCGDMCGRARDNDWCSHRCTLQCHPGPCPPCNAFVRRKCSCGAQTLQVKCATLGSPVSCGAVCGARLACGVHECGKECHEGECGDCGYEARLTCHCGGHSKVVACREAVELAKSNPQDCYELPKSLDASNPSESGTRSDSESVLSDVCAETPSEVEISNVDKVEQIVDGVSLVQLNRPDEKAPSEQGGIPEENIEFEDTSHQPNALESLKENESRESSPEQDSSTEEVTGSSVDTNEIPDAAESQQSDASPSDSAVKDSQEESAEADSQEDLAGADSQDSSEADSQDSAKTDTQADSSALNSSPATPQPHYSCGERCPRLLSCGYHRCGQLCHSGACGECPLAVAAITRCPCGKRSLEELYAPAEDTSKDKGKGIAGEGFWDFDKSLKEYAGSDCEDESEDEVEHIDGDLTESSRKQTKAKAKPSRSPQKPLNRTPKRRTACTDPVPTCGAVCGRELSCGPAGARHTCRHTCHSGDCPPCGMTTATRCRCGNTTQLLPCGSPPVLCVKVCKKKRLCGRHKCGLACCVLTSHPCSNTCNKSLSCNKHRCKEPCHQGPCERCWEVSWTEVTCHCGSSALPPPVACGTPLPACQQPCGRAQACQHPASHACHPAPPCPPCTALVSAPCHGGHKTMKATPCHEKAMSCGMPCGKPLKCGRHACARVCHAGPCQAGKGCPQSCQAPRRCRHPCGQPCHAGACPSTPCQAKVSVQCPCGRRQSTASCAEAERQATALQTGRLAGRASLGAEELQAALALGSKERFHTLACDDACLAKQRTARLALALQIENPDSRNSLGQAATQHVYSEFLKSTARSDPSFAATVHAQLVDLVMKARESKQRVRSHYFNAMKRSKRDFVHEYAQAFGCTSHTYANPPAVNVVVSAERGVCLLPLAGVGEVVARERGGHTPAPVPARRQGGSGSTGGGLTRLERAPAPKPAPAIDMFDLED